MQQGRYHFLALLRVSNAFEGSEVLQQLLGAHAGVHAEFLRQIAQHPAHGLFVAQHVDVVEHNTTGIGVLQRGNGAHQAGLARAVGPQQAKHARWDVETNVFQGLSAVGVGLG